MTPSQRPTHASDPLHPASPPSSASQAPYDKNRRRFLFALGAGSAGAAAASQPLAASLAATEVPAVPESGQGYRETEHVRDYYATTRL